MPIFILSLIVQIFLIIHVIRTGRDRIWIWVLLFLPLAGGLAYLILELLPEWRRSMGGQKTLRQVKQTLDPGGAVSAVPIDGGPLPLPISTPVTVGGATVFTFQVERYEVF